jgi:hypothetical protein
MAAESSSSSSYLPIRISQAVRTIDKAIFKLQLRKLALEHYYHKNTKIPVVYYYSNIDTNPLKKIDDIEQQTITLERKVARLVRQSFSNQRFLTRQYEK